MARAPEGAFFLAMFLKPNRFVDRQPGFAR
jgi:hypothetical protein